jgi:hypothetical protein
MLIENRRELELVKDGLVSVKLKIADQAKRIDFNRMSKENRSEIEDGMQEDIRIIEKLFKDITDELESLKKEEHKE